MLFESLEVVRQSDKFIVATCTPVCGVVFTAETNLNTYMHTCVYLVNTEVSHRVRGGMHLVGKIVKLSCEFRSNVCIQYTENKLRIRFRDRKSISCHHNASPLTTTLFKAYSVPCDYNLGSPREMKELCMCFRLEATLYECHACKDSHAT